MTDNLITRAREALTAALVIHTDIVAKRAEGVYVEDEDGTRYMDFTSGLATTNTGHNHPRVVEAIKEQADSLIHSGCIFHSEPMVTLSETFREVTPAGLDTFFYANSGAEAVEGALKLARFTTKRQGIIAFTGAFHGRTFGAVSLTASNARYRHGYHPLLPSVYHSPYPYCYRCPLGQSRDTCNIDCYDYLERLLKQVVHPEDVAAIIIEPLLGEGGYVVPPDDFLRRLRTLCDRWGIFLIFDEVQCGMGRTGKFFASEHIGVVPDIMTLAKGIASGMPLGAIVSRKEIMKTWPPGAHGTTFGGNPISCAAAIATVKVIREEGLLENARAVGEVAMKRLTAMRERHPSIGDVRGRGLMIGVEIVKNGKEPDPEGLKRIADYSLTKGLILLECGTERSIIRLAPPLIIGEEEMERGLSIMEEAFESLEGGE
ncbi:MAG: aspartate aminotransferase family protein [Thermodesulfobacteriota bacterium]